MSLFKTNVGIRPKQSCSTDIWNGSCFYDAQELLRNGGGTICRKNCGPFLAELNIFETFEAILFFFKKNYPNIFHLTLKYFKYFTI